MQFFVIGGCSILVAVNLVAGILLLRSQRVKAEFDLRRANTFGGIAIFCSLAGIAAIAVAQVVIPEGVLYTTLSAAERYSPLLYSLFVLAFGGAAMVWGIMIRRLLGT